MGRKQLPHSWEWKLVVFGTPVLSQIALKHKLQVHTLSSLAQRSVGSL